MPSQASAGRRRKGRGGRQQDRNNRSRSKSKGRKEQQSSGIKDEDLKFMIGEHQAENFGKLKRYLAEKAESKYGATMPYIIEEEKEFPFDTPIKAKSKLGTDATAEEKASEKESIEALHTKELEALVETKQTHVLHKQQLCGYLTSKISDGLYNELSREEDFHQKKRVDPVWLLKRIKHYCTTYKGTTYLPATHINAMHGVTSLRQYESETVLAHAERLKSRFATFWNGIDLTGEPTYHDLANTCVPADCDENKLTDEENKKILNAAKAKAREAIMAYTLIVKSHDKRFKDLKDDLVRNTDQNITQYPDTLAAAMEMLITHERKHKRTNKEKEKSGKNNNNNNNKDKQRENPNDKVAASFAQLSSNNQLPNNWRCMKCGSKSCNGNKGTCPKCDAPADKQAWQIAMDKMDQSHAHAPVDTSSNTSTVSSVTQPSVSAAQTTPPRSPTPPARSSPSKPKLPAWMNSHIATHQPHQARILNNLSACSSGSPPMVSLVTQLDELDLHEGLMLDTGTAATIACNSSLADDISLASDPLPVNTNGGQIQVKHAASVPDLIDLPAWFFPDGIANVVAMADIEDHPDCDITYDKHRLAFIVINLRTGKRFEFIRTATHRLYMYYPNRDDDEASRTQDSHVHTIKDNSIPHSKNQQERAQ